MSSRSAVGHLARGVSRYCGAVTTAARPRYLLQPLSPASISPSLVSLRHSSHSPIGATPANPRKKVTMQTIQNMYKKGEPISVLTAHDFPSGHVADLAGMDIILVGDSLAMVALGMEDTSEVLLDEMILHCRSVARAARSAFTVRVCCEQLETRC